MRLCVFTCWGLHIDLRFFLENHAQGMSKKSYRAYDLSNHGRDGCRHYLTTWKVDAGTVRAWDRSEALRNNALIATAWAPVIETCQALDSCASGDALHAFFASMSLKSH